MQDRQKQGCGRTSAAVLGRASPPICDEQGGVDVSPAHQSMGLLIYLLLATAFDLRRS
jgi:hypothetical protein